MDYYSGADGRIAMEKVKRVLQSWCSFGSLTSCLLGFSRDLADLVHVR